MLQVTKTKLEGVLLIQPPTIFEDFRGSYVETYNEELYQKAGIIKMVQDDISTSSRHVLRGLHGDGETWKLVSCPYGKFYLVVLNYDQESKQFGQWESFALSDTNRLQVLIPPKFGNGHLILSETAIFHYKQSCYYNRAGQFSIAWNDARFKIWWPVKDPVLSQRDAGL
ncbi:MAG: dTDP-4-dehydrorhamnose 3,5-epimerase family protein [Verrucomicrobiota bacterium]|jgi:dTDP-4-dehydrorhamnose 3,5-epimerase